MITQARKFVTIPEHVIRTMHAGLFHMGGCTRGLSVPTPGGSRGLSETSIP